MITKRIDTKASVSAAGNNNLLDRMAAEEYCGLSTDTKPTEGVATNALFLELNTGDFYYFNGTGWAKVGG